MKYILLKSSILNTVTTRFMMSKQVSICRTPLFKFVMHHIAKAHKGHHVKHLLYPDYIDLFTVDKVLKR